MILNRKEFLKVLNKLKPGLGKDDYTEQVSSFIFEPETIRSYNEQISIQIPFETGLSGAVKAKEFYDLISKFPDESIEIVEDNNEFRISGVQKEEGKRRKRSKKNREAGIVVEDEIKIPPIAEGKESYQDLPSNFTDALSFCLFSTSKDKSIPYQNCLYVNKSTVTSFDSFRGTIYKLSSDVKASFLINSTAAKELIKYKPISFYIDGAFIHFKNEDEVIFSCRQIVSDFPNLKEFFFSSTGDKIVLPDDFDKVVDRTATLASMDAEGDKFIEVHLKKGELICRGESDIGWVEEKIDMKYNGDEIKFLAHPSFLKEITVHTKDMCVLSGNRLMFEDKDFRHVMAMTE